MPSVGYVFKRITAVVSEDGDFGLAITNTEDRLYRVLSNVAKEHGINSPQGTVIQFPLTHEDLSFLTIIPVFYFQNVTLLQTVVRMSSKVEISAKQFKRNNDYAISNYWDFRPPHLKQQYGSPYSFCS
jgi:hypothetical protein